MEICIYGTPCAPFKTIRLPPSSGAAIFTIRKVRMKFLSRCLPPKSSHSDDSFGNDNDSTPLKELSVSMENTPSKLSPNEPDSYISDQPTDFLSSLNIKLDSEDAYQLLLYGSGALVAIYLASAVVGVIDSIPLFPKLMELVGLGYSLWFTTRNLLYKRDREKLAEKLNELKEEILGTD